MNSEKQSSTVNSSLRFNEACFSYGGPPALTGITGQVNAGEALALVGPNGSGKTTLLRGILRLVKLSSGQMELLGSTDPSKSRRLIGYVPQLADLDPQFPVTVRHVVTMGLYPQIGWCRFPRAKHRKLVMSALERVDMTHRASLRFGMLSGGQQQRVLLARAIVAGPRILLLDEPFNGLDQPNRDALLTTIESLKSEGIAIVVSTHDLSLAHKVCEKALLVSGKQIAFGPREQILSPDTVALAYGDRVPSILHVDESATSYPVEPSVSANV